MTRRVTKLLEEFYQEIHFPSCHSGQRKDTHILHKSAYKRKHICFCSVQYHAKDFDRSNTNSMEGRNLRRGRRRREGGGKEWHCRTIQDRLSLLHSQAICMLPVQCQPQNIKLCGIACRQQGSSFCWASFCSIQSVSLWLYAKGSFVSRPSVESVDSTIIHSPGFSFINSMSRRCYFVDFCQF